MADDKKTQLGAPGGAAVDSKAKTSYLPAASNVDPLVGSTLADRYLIDRKLGEGGMGAVYLATHNLLEKHVALKILHGEFARKPDLVERFMQEAKSASRIRHENVIDISDFGATPEGLVFFAMELLKGHDLHDEIARARVSGHLLPWLRTKKIFLQICAALSAAHAKGVVHRDLKPENIYLVEFLGDPDFVKLLDFGIAKLTETGEGEGGRKLTKTGMLFGTPEYMSPEQARGEHVDHRVDIYAMGCILFQLVTNRVPFEAENFMGVLSMHLTEPPPSIPPEVFDQIGAPRALAGVIDRALDKDRNARYQTIEELANAVRVVSGDPPLAADRTATPLPASVPSPAQTTTRRAVTPAVTAQVAAPSGAITGEKSTRVRTQWTGNISVPEEAVDPPPKSRSKLPLIVGGGVIVAAGAIAAVFALGGKHDAPAPAPAPQVAPAPPPVPAPHGSAATVDKPLGMISLELHSTPEGAAITDVANNRIVGKTPFTFAAPGAHGTHPFSFHLKGYGDASVELPIDGTLTTYTQPLAKGAASSPPVVVRPATNDDVKIKGSPVTHPDEAPVTHPEQAATPPAKGSDDVPAPPVKPAGEDVTPTLKGFGSGS
ncbi:MAG TPA: serine/threonine-protein kinase [Kofleriaceae bacterium]|nr:serine/threonine-protein kinase [Kofleriaceae bacterium]